MRRATVLALVVVLAGCSAPLPGDLGTTPTRTALPSDTTESTAHLDILSQGPFSLTILEYGGETVVLNRSFEGTTLVEYGDSGEIFEPGEHYRVVITVDGSVRWNRTVHAYEQYSLDVAPNGSVTVRSHGED